MAPITKSFLFLVFSLFSEGMCQHCEIEDLMITQSKAGVIVKGKPEFEVKVLNECPCLQSNVKLFCDGFQSLEKIDPLILAKSGTECLLNNGSSIGPFAQVKFTYAWDIQFPFKPLSSDINCV